MTGAVAGGSSPAGGKRRSPEPSRPLALAVAVACAGTLVTGIGYAAWHATPPSAERGAAEQSEQSEQSGRTGSSGSARPVRTLDLTAVNAILDRRARALRAGDRAGFLAAVGPAFRPRQGALFDDLRKLPLAIWRQRADPARPMAEQAAGPADWTVRVTLRYRLRGFDRTDVEATQYLTFARRHATDTGGGAGLTITGDGAAQGLLDDPQIWDGGRLFVVAGRRSLVIGAGAQPARLRQIAARLDRAVPAVSAVVGGDWARRAVALVPATPEQAAALAGGGQSLRELAALATVTRGAAGAPGNDRIVISPAGYPKLNEIGRHVVLTHELTHVATHGVADTRTPVWLIEGLADYVGYKGLNVPVPSAARELRREVRAGRLPAELPGEKDFAGATGRLPEVYEEAWLACRMVAERYGEDRLVRLYRTAGTRADALRRVLGLDTAEFTAMWRDYLRRELR